MQGSASPSKYGSPSCSHRTWSRTRSMARRTAASPGSTPNARSSTRLHVVEVHAGNRVPCRWGPSECHHFSASLELKVGVRGVGQITHHLPADRRIAIEKPVNQVHVYSPQALTAPFMSLYRPPVSIQHGEAS